MTLAPSLAGKASAADTLFVFAREMNGPPLPVAIVRATKRDLPFTFQLDDSTSPMPSRKLSSTGPVVIVARLSKSGPQILSARMMLEWLAETKRDPQCAQAAQAIERAVEKTLADRKNHTAEIGGTAKTAAVGDAVTEAITRGN